MLESLLAAALVALALRALVRGVSGKLHPPAATERGCAGCSGCAAAARGICAGSEVPRPRDAAAVLAHRPPVG